MSLYIDIDEITAVLLADGWHDVADRSFSLDSYELLWSGFDGMTIEQARKEHPDKDPMLLQGGGQHDICAICFTLKTDDGTHLYGPLTSILAVRTA